MLAAPGKQVSLTINDIIGGAGQLQSFIAELRAAIEEYEASETAKA